MNTPIPAPQYRCTTTDASERLDCRQARLVQSRLGSQSGPEVVVFTDGTQQPVSLRQALTLVDASGGPTPVFLPAPTLANCGMNAAYSEGLVKTVLMAVRGNVPVNVVAGRASQLLEQNDSVTYMWSQGSWTVIGSSNSPGGVGGVVDIGRSLFVSSVTGSDETALPNRLDLQYATITAAMSASVSGDVVYVYPGLYDAEPDNVLNMRSGVNVFAVDTCELFQFGGGDRVRPASTTIRAVLDVNVADESYSGTIAGICVESPAGLGQTLRINGANNVQLYCLGCQFSQGQAALPGEYGMDLNATNGGMVCFRQCSIVTSETGGGDPVMMRIADNLSVFMTDTNVAGSWVCTGQNALVALDKCTVALFQESELACRFQASYTSVNSISEDAVLQIYASAFNATNCSFQGDTELRGEVVCVGTKFERFLELVDVVAPGYTQSYDHCQFQSVQTNGYMGRLTFRGCVFDANDVFRFAMVNAAGQLTFHNCSIAANQYLDLRITQLGAAIRFFNCTVTVNADAIAMMLYTGPPDATVGLHVLANNTFFSTFNTPWIASTNAINITTGGNAVSNAAAANVTATPMVVV